MNRMYVHTGAAVVVAACLGGVMFTATADAKDWSQWRGPNDNFTTQASDLADKWPEGGPRKIWTRDLGPGYSGISAVADRLYTMYRDGDHDVVVALDAANGKTIWEHRYEAKPGEKQTKEFGTGPNSTPLVWDDRVFTIGFTGRLHCLNRVDGKPFWSHDLVKDFDGKLQEFGYAASPVRYKDSVIVLVGGKKHGVIAFNPSDGQPNWKSDPFDISYATPVIITVDGQDQIVFMSSTEVIGIAAADGKLEWRHPCVNRYKNNATDPIWGEDNLLWVATQLDGGARMLKLARQDGKTNVEQIWFNKEAKVFHWNAVRVGDHVYGSLGGSTTFLSAVDVRTGEIKWKERGFHKALCVYADEKLVFLDENGTLALAKVSPEGVDIRSQAQLTEKVSWTVPTLVGKTLYVRDKKSIMALDLG